MTRSMAGQLHRAWHLHRLAALAYQDGRPSEAGELVQQAIALDPQVASFHADLAVMLKGIAPDEERLQHSRRAIELEPGNPVYRANLAATLNSLRRHTEAEQAARSALGLAPLRAQSWHNLGSALAGQQRWDESLHAYERAIALGLNTGATRTAAARTALSAKAFPAAIEHWTAALALPGLSLGQQVECRAGLGKAHEARGEGEAALHAFRQALALDETNAALWIDLGNLHKRLRQTEGARECYGKVLRLLPDCVEALFNLATVSQDLGLYAAAIDGYSRALACNPALAAGWHNLAACLTYSADTRPCEVRSRLAQFEGRIAAPLRQARVFPNPRGPQRLLRIGYVSADFRAHPVGYLALPLIEGHDRTQVHVTCYSSHYRSDEWTQRFQAAADAWVEAHALDDAALAALIAGDGIDILVDLAGHTEGNRLLAFARKPAPVQVTWMGYVTTTGMRSMDWRLTHADADPPESEAEYSEKLWRLPGAMWCFRPLPAMPQVAPSPVLENGFVTFGALNRFSKNSPQALAAWAEILHRAPGSRLLICAAPGEASERLRSVFSAAGIGADRVDVFAPVHHARFWALHALIDIALDSFPFNGGMTSCESLWMGVPVVSCCGRDGGGDEHSFPARFASRMGRALLNGIGLGSLASNTIPGYVDAAVGLAEDVNRLSALRHGLRDRMMASPLMDERRFVGEVELAYRAMWRAYCEAGDE